MKISTKVNKTGLKHQLQRLFYRKPLPTPIIKVFLLSHRWVLSFWSAKGYYSFFICLTHFFKNIVETPQSFIYFWYNYIKANFPDWSVIGLFGMNDRPLAEKSLFYNTMKELERVPCLLKTCLRRPNFLLVLYVLVNRTIQVDWWCDSRKITWLNAMSIRLIVRGSKRSLQL